MSTGHVVNGADEFSASAQRIVDYLNAHTPIADWSVSRIAGGEQVHLHVHDEGVLSRGRRVPWEDTMCKRMLEGGAQVVPDTQEDDDYADHPDAGLARTYVGFPLTDDEGNTFGTLCGVGMSPLGSADEVDDELLGLMRDLLSSQLTLCRKADLDRRAAELAEAVAHTDALTGLVNRRGWDLILTDAEERVAAYGDPVAIGVVDLDGLKGVNDIEGHEAGDRLLRRAAGALAVAASPDDRVARYGGDEFAILANNVPISGLDDHFGRFLDALNRVGIAASIGHAATNAGVIGVTDAFVRADAEMYQVKQSRKAS